MGDRHGIQTGALTPGPACKDVSPASVLPGAWWLGLRVFQETVGYSGSDIKLVCREAAMRPVRKIFNALENHQSGTVGMAAKGLWERKRFRNLAPTSRWRLASVPRGSLHWHSFFGGNPSAPNSFLLLFCFGSTLPPEDKLLRARAFIFLVHYVGLDPFAALYKY